MTVINDRVINDPYDLVDTLLDMLIENDGDIKYEKAKEFMNNYFDYLKDFGEGW